jgi:hypothetical protein
MNPESPKSARSVTFWFVPALAIYVALITVWGLPLGYPEDGLDPSWIQALVEATDQRRVFGSEVVFTFGPLHQLLTGQVGQDWSAFLLGRALFSVAWFVIVLLVGRLFGARPALGIALAVSLTSNGAVHYGLLAVLGIVLGFRVHARTSETGFAGTLLLGTLACACAVVPLAKLSFVGTSIPALVALIGPPALRVAFRREPLSPGLGCLVLIPVLLVTVVWGSLVNWSLRSFLHYFLGPNVDIVQGYSSAMSFPTTTLSWTLALCYFMLTAYAAGLFWKFQVGETTAGPRAVSLLPATAWICAGTFGLLSWVVFKSAFVRADPSHLSNAVYWIVGVLILLLTLPSGRLRSFVREKSLSTSAVVFLMPFALGLILLVGSEDRPSMGWIKDYLIGSVRNLRLFSASGRQAATEERVAVLSRLRASTEDYGIAAGASADIVPWDISRLLANNLKYAPRPVPQSYSVYTSRLQRLNRDFVLDSPARPDYYVVAVGDIDERLPIGLDSPLLLNLRQSYAFSHRGSKGTLVFKRKPEADPTVARVETLASGNLRWAVREGVTRWSSSLIQLPVTSASALVLQATFKDGVTRNALQKLFRPFSVQIEYLDAAGNVLHKARFIPEAVDEMLIYPLTRTNEDLLGILYSGWQHSVPTGSPIPSAVRFSVKDFAVPFEVSEYRLLGYHFTASP